MAKGDGAATDIYLFLIQIQFTVYGNGGHRKGLVNFKQINVSERIDALFQQLCDRLSRSQGKPLRLPRRAAPTLDPHQRSDSQLQKFAVRHHNQRRGAVADRGSIPSGHRAILAKAGRSDFIFSIPNFATSSSCATTCSCWFATAVTTGTISLAKSPFRWAA